MTAQYHYPDSDSVSDVSLSSVEGFHAHGAEQMPGLREYV